MFICEFPNTSVESFVTNIGKPPTTIFEGRTLIDQGEIAREQCLKTFFCIMIISKNNSFVFQGTTDVLIVD